MQARIVAAARGAQWLLDGWRLFRQAPVAWFVVSLVFLLITQLLTAIPLIGPVVSAILIPAMTLGLMACARASSHGSRINVGLLFDGLRNEGRRQLLLGCAYAAAWTIVFGLVMWMDDAGVLLATMRGQGDGTHLEDALLLSAVLAALYLPIALLFWYAPPLVSWHGAPVSKALFFSLVACCLNWRAFAAYAIATVVSVVVPGLFVMLAMKMMGSPPNPWQVAPLFLIFVLPPVFASYYASYRDVFGYDPAP